MGRSIVILQARLTSKRLPLKLLLPLSGYSILEHIIMRIKKASRPDGFVIATTEDTAKAIGHIADFYDVRIITGDEKDVLGRFVKAAIDAQAEHIVRTTGDNPLVSIKYIDRTLELHLESGADLTTYPLLPLGTGVEVIKREALIKAHREAEEDFEREHITQYIYRNENDFKIIRGVPDSPYLFPELRLTVDNEMDYRFLKHIYSNLFKGSVLNLKEVISFVLKTENYS